MHHPPNQSQLHAWQTILGPPCSAVMVWRWSIISNEETLPFHFALGLANYIAVPASKKPFFNIHFYLFIWLHWVLVVARRTFGCSMQTLRCSLWDLAPWPEIKPRPLALGAQSLSHWTTKEVPRTHLYCPLIPLLHKTWRAFLQNASCFITTCQNPTSYVNIE